MLSTKFYRLIIQLTFLVIFLVSGPVRLWAEVVTDGTVGPALSLSGPAYLIPDSFGTTAGNNLFHSFQRFSLTMAESATFTGPGHIENVISRVTGGEMSTIDGLLQSQVGQADVFFINPAGIVFGPNARVDVPAAFHVSTADELRFSDDSVFSAREPDISTLSVAPPGAFGFLALQPASITLNGSQFEFTPGSPVSFSAGDMEISGTENQEASLISQGGIITLTSAGEQGSEIPLQNKASGKVNGELRITSARVNASGNGGGQVSISAGNTELDNASISADNTGDRNADGGINFSVNGQLEIKNDTEIFSDAYGPGSGGNVAIHAKDFHMDNAMVTSETAGAGDAGKIFLNVTDTLEIVNGASISSSTYGQGNAGSVKVDAGSGLINDGGIEEFTGIWSETYSGTGNAGTVEIVVDGLLTLLNGAEISSSTFAQGNAGNVTLIADELKIDGGDTDQFTGLASQANAGSQGDAGGVAVTVIDLVELKHGAQISSSTFAQGNAGRVEINAGKLIIDSQGSVDLSTGVLSQAYSDSNGNAGEVDITIEDSLTIFNGGEIASSTFSRGNAGNLTINAGSLKIDGEGTDLFTGLASQAGYDSQGDAGAVKVTVDGLMELINGAEINSSTFAAGNAGNLTVNTAIFKIDGGGTGRFTGLASQANAGSIGDAGSIAVAVAGSMELVNGAEISSSTYGLGNAGSVQISSEQLKIDDIGTDSQFTGITSETYSDTGDAGKVSVNVSEWLNIFNGAAIVSDTFAKGNAGNVLVNAGGIYIDGGTTGQFTGISSDANTNSQGEAGSVIVAVGGLMELVNGGEISSSTYGIGNAGSLSILAGSLIVDNQGLVDQYTGISSKAYADSMGDAGEVDITIENLLALINGGDISSSTFANGNAGNVTASAGEIYLDAGGTGQFTGLASQANSGSLGNAGTVTITVDGLMELYNGAQIASSTYGQGDAGSVKITSGQLIVDDQGTLGQYTGIWSETYSETGDAGTVDITTEGLLALLNGGEISSSTFSWGNAGNVTVHAGCITMDEYGSGQFTGISSIANEDSGGRAGAVEVTITGSLEIKNGAEISSSTYSLGDAGNLKIHAGQLLIDNLGVADQVTGISSKATAASFGNAGTVEVTVDQLLAVINGGEISSSTFSLGNAGNVMIKAGGLMIDGGGSNQFTGLVSQANTGSLGDAGSVILTVDGLMQLINGAEISSSTFGWGDAGSVTINAESAKIDDQGTIGQFTGITSETYSDTGNAGTVTVNVSKLLEIINGAAILSDTYAGGNAGNVTVNAGDMTLDEYGCSQYTGISSAAKTGSQGDAGTVSVSVGGLLKIINGAEISSSTYAKGNAGSLDIHAGELLIDDYGVENQFTGIASQAGSDSLGDAGTVEVTIDELLRIINGGGILSNTFSIGKAGSVKINAGELIIDGNGIDQFTGITSQASPGSQGDAGAVIVNVDGRVELINKAELSSGTFGEGAAGSVTINADAMKIGDQEGDAQFTGISTNANSGKGDAGTVSVSIEGLLELLNGAVIASEAYAAGDAGNVRVKAGCIEINQCNSGLFTGISSNANITATGDAGTVSVSVDKRLNLANGAEISSSTYGLGDAGSVMIDTAELKIDNQGPFDQVTGIMSKANQTAQGDAGEVSVTVAGLLELARGAVISSDTFSVGEAGNVTVNAGKIKIDRDGSSLFTGISSQAAPGSEGDAGAVIVTVDGLMALINGGIISSDTFAAGNAGNVSVHATEFIIDGYGSTNLFTGISSQAGYGSQGDAGAVKVTVDGLLEIMNGGTISSDTFTVGNAGNITISAGEFKIDGQGAQNLFTGITSQASAGSQGDAGTVKVDVTGLLELINGAEISSSTWSEGNAGSVSVCSGGLKMDNRGINDQLTGIVSQAYPYSQGNAGKVTVQVDSVLALFDGAAISSSTWSEGSAGNVSINALNIAINGENTNIACLAKEAATGYVGSIQIKAADITISNGGQINTAAYQTLPADRISEIPATLISIDADQLHLTDGAQITAESTINVPASAIEIQAQNIVVENESQITTSSNDGDGGPITIQGAVIILQQGLVTTSVEGLSGNGGDITITGRSPADVLVFEEGFIQANTAAKGASGGNIFIDARAVIAEADRLAVGGQERQIFEPGTGLNVIQAAAPGGEQGTIHITAPELDISGSLVNLAANYIEPVRLATDPCTAVGGEKASALVIEGRGGMPAGPDEPSIVPLGGDRLDRLQK